MNFEPLGRPVLALARKVAMVKKIKEIHIRDISKKEQNLRTRYGGKRDKGTNIINSVTRYLYYRTPKWHTWLHAREVCSLTSH